jgi:hypothetical protein
VYRQEQGASVTDQHNFSYSYIHRIASNSRSALKVSAASSSSLLLSREASSNVGMGMESERSKFSQEMEKLLQDCVLWDTISLGISFQGALDLLLSDTSVGISSTNGRDNRTQEHYRTGSNITPSSSSSSLTLPFQPELSFSLIRTVFQAFDAPLRILHQTVRTVSSQLSLR